MTERRLGKQQQVTFPFLRIAEKGGNINRNGLMSPSCSISPLGFPQNDFFQQPLGLQRMAFLTTYSRDEKKFIF